MSEKMFIIYLVRMICEAKDEIREQMWTMNDHTNKELKVQLQKVKDHFNKEIEILKANQTEILEMKKTINQIKTSVENITDKITWKTEPQAK